VFPPWEHWAGTEAGNGEKQNKQEKMRMIKFYYNGVREDGKLNRCFFSKGPYSRESGLDDETITIYARDSRFGKEMRELFTIENNTEIMIDYFEDDRVRVSPDHPLYASVNAAWEKSRAHIAKVRAKRNA